MAKKKVISEYEFAQICLKCPYKECTSDFWGNCPRTKPYTIPKPKAKKGGKYE